MVAKDILNTELDTIMTDSCSQKSIAMWANKTANFGAHTKFYSHLASARCRVDHSLCSETEYTELIGACVVKWNILLSRSEIM